MEVYFDNLTTDKVSLNKLVEDVSLLVQDAEELVKTTGAKLPEAAKEELHNTLLRVKSRSERIKQQALAGARATDRVIRLHPYQSLAIVFGLGFLLGLVAKGSNSKDL